MSADNFTPERGISRPKVVVIGGGFAGIAVVRELRDNDAEVTLVVFVSIQPYLNFAWMFL